ncbi:hypothetical protein CSUB01_08881 [Colletotrichum sublineola]|uniref:Uncharacterized protein n=1 Tax=Colletotrichum sublineola TaxID=1173701 RepID=A0A066XGB5_COLSU|nr:hypothetical protein CSUB01_08881 [Colletotrichum sublineola]
MATQTAPQSRVIKSTETPKPKEPVGAGPPIAATSPQIESPPIPKRPNPAPRSSSNTSLKRVSIAPKPADSPVHPAPPTDESSAAPGALRRSLSFKIPIRVATDNNFPPVNRSRAQSLPHQTQEPNALNHKRQNSKRGSLSSIGENRPTPDLDKPRAQSPIQSSESLSEQFLKERGLINSESSDEATSPEEVLQDQVFKYLTTMSSNAKATTEEPSRAPAYPTSYPPANTGMKGTMQAPGLPVPMPNLSGNANGPVGNLLKGPVDENGKLTSAALMVGIKLDLEAEVHLTARVRGDILVGLY